MGKHARERTSYIYNCKYHPYEYCRLTGSGLCLAYPLHSSVPTSKQHLHTQRVSNDHAHVPLVCGNSCINSFGQHTSGLHSRTVMDQQHSWIGSEIDGIQLRASVFPSMLFDPVLSEEILQIEAMGGGVSHGPMATCKHP